VQSRAPWPEFGRVFQVSGFGKADYNALAAKLRRRFSSGLTYLVSYTWSKSIDTGSGIRVPPGDQQFTQNEFCVPCDRATSSFSADQRFVTSLLYELPFGKGKPFLNHGGLMHAMAKAAGSEVGAASAELVIGLEQITLHLVTSAIRKRVQKVGSAAAIYT
jgi:hypothetical protein